MADRVRRRRRKGEPFAAWFWSQVQVGPGCWTWSGSTNGHGYGLVRDETGRLALAHRVAFRLVHGAVPEGLNVLHRCDNPPCCRPSSLFAGTQAENMADAAAKGRAGVWGRTAPRDAGGRYAALTEGGAGGTP